MTSERREHRVFRSLLKMIPGLEDRILEGEDGEVLSMAELVRRPAQGPYRCI